MFCPMWERESFVLWWTWTVRGEAHPHAATVTDRDDSEDVSTKSRSLDSHRTKCVSARVSVSLPVRYNLFTLLSLDVKTSAIPYLLLTLQEHQTSEQEMGQHCKYVLLFRSLTYFFFFPLFICLAFEKQEKKIEALLNSVLKRLFTFNYQIFVFHKERKVSSSAPTYNLHQ